MTGSKIKKKCRICDKIQNSTRNRSIKDYSIKKSSYLFSRKAIDRNRPLQILKVIIWKDKNYDI
ncbi:unnamed protein product [Paramecium octaurelia]|uniref:Uncharacterized protein n=1 Tax=Paramecium octaurelia TaxID=43137 RepID=A0A8S1YLS5_PAROT|nr:unnamed protein product [Paramecium octaurelia]